MKITYAMIQDAQGHASIGFLGKNCIILIYILCITPALLNNHSSSLTFIFMEENCVFQKLTVPSFLIILLYLVLK